MANLFEVVTVAQLKVNDSVKIVNLTDGKVTENAVVTYLYLAAEFEVSTPSGGLTYYGAFQVKNLVIIRGVPKPENWPPKPNDVWLIGGYVWHTLGGSSSLHFRRASAASTSSLPETILRDHGNGTAKLLYRHS